MPALELRIPKLTKLEKEELAQKLTAVFADSSGFPAEIFGIHFQEYEYGEAASGGKICDGNSRPFIHFVFYCPRVSKEVKQKLVSSFSVAYTDLIGHADWKPVVHICEHPYDNIGVDGALLSDSYEELGGKEFYYKL